jgi:predicted RNase H-like HicB family nuclease
MKVYPLVFGIRHAIAGRGFLAGVSINGRALLEVDEDGLWWMTGVEPGGVAASGETPDAAYASFRETLRLILFDSAHLTDSLASFEGDVKSLGHQRNEAAAARWDVARQEIRAGATVDADFAAALPRLTKDVTCGVTIMRLDKTEHAFKPQDNKPDKLLTAA